MVRVWFEAGVWCCVCVCVEVDMYTNGLYTLACLDYISFNSTTSYLFSSHPVIQGAVMCVWGGVCVLYVLVCMCCVCSVYVLGVCCMCLCVCAYVCTCIFQ